MLFRSHGGYWRAQDKSGYSFLAENLVKAGVTVAIPNYSLCPNVEVRDIVMQMVQACAWLFRNASNFGAPRNRLIVSGHSAGGHLTAMMLACVWPAFAADLPPDLVKAGLSISGIFDAREVVKAPSINGDVRLTRKSAEVVSPVLMPPASEAPLYLAVGGKETGGFHFQHNLIKKKWGKVIAEDVPCPDDNHFTILDQFASTESDLFQATLRMLNR